MTNTRITDPEILERRYPVILKRFSLREGSGGKGKSIGGDGVIREIQFLKLNILIFFISFSIIKKPINTNPIFYRLDQ